MWLLDFHTDAMSDLRVVTKLMIFQTDKATWQEIATWINVEQSQLNTSKVSELAFAENKKNNTEYLF